MFPIVGLFELGSKQGPYSAFNYQFRMPDKKTPLKRLKKLYFIRPFLD